MMNRGLMKRQMFAMGGPVRMQQGGLAGISRSLQGANESLGNAQQQLQIALGSNGGMGSPMGGIMGLQAPQQRRSPPAFSDMVGNPMGKIGAIQEQIAPPVGMEKGGAAPTLQPQEFFDFRRIPGGPIPGGVTYYDDPTFRPDASNIEMRAMAQFLSGTEGVSPQTMFERILRLSNSELRNLKNSIPMSAFTEFQPRGDQTIEEMIQENEEMFNQKMRQVERPPQGMEKGGAAFPDLTGDGKVTYADILKGRGVEMQMGGEPMMAQQAAMMQAPMPQDPSMDQAMAQAAQVGVDPAAVEGMLSQVSEGIGNLDDAEDFEQVMNSMRGNEAPISERYAELAEVVGEEDAEATPESVLALVQPVMQMAQVDQGIGGLAQEEMSAPVEGNMAGGIMSTVNMGEEVPAPVNFNQGGPVVAMAPGGVVGKAATMQPGFRDLYASVLGDPAERQAEFDEQKRLTQAQMLFDIANTALAFATPGERQMSPAERLAAVTQETQLFDKIGARSQSLQDLKTKQKEAERQLDLAALDASIREASAAEREAAAIRLAEAKKKETTIKGVPLSVYQTLTEDEKQRLILGDPSGVNGIPRDIFDKLTDEDQKLILGTTQLPGDVKGIPAAVFEKLTKEQKDRVILGDPMGVNGVPRDIFDKLSQANKDKVLGIADGPVKGIPRALFNELSKEDRDRVLLGDPQGVNGIPRDIFDKLPEAERKRILGTAPESVKGVPRDIYDSLTQDSKDMLLGISLDVKGVPASIYNKLNDEDQKKLLGIVPVVADKYKLEEVQTDEGIKLFVFNETDGTRELAETFDPVATGALVKFRITNPDGTVTEAVELLNSKAGKELQKKVNAAKKIDPQSASIVKVGTEQVNPQAYLTIDGNVVTSFDNRTFFNPKTNKVMSLSDPTVQAQALGDANVYEIIKTQNILNYGKKRLEELSKDVDSFTYTDSEGTPLDQGQ